MSSAAPVNQNELGTTRSSRGMAVTCAPSEAHSAGVSSSLSSVDPTKRTSLGFVGNWRALESSPSVRLSLFFQRLDQAFHDLIKTPHYQFCASSTVRLFDAFTIERKGSQGAGEISQGRGNV